MSGKKQKALEQELIDDLLEDQTDEVQGSNANNVISDEGGPVEAVPPAENLAQKAPREVTVANVEPEEEELSAYRPPSEEEPAPKPVDIDPTLRLGEEKKQRRAPSPPAGQAEDEVRASVGRYGAFRNNNAAGAALAQSENLRIAQGKILELEQEVERLRLENEQLAAAAETFRRKSDELKARAEDLDNRYTNAASTHSQEKSLLVENKERLRHEMDEMRNKNEELELRISTNIQKIRVRERELENRLELVKMESAALIRSKDEMILDLKRQIDQINLELNNYRIKSQELNRMILDKQDILRRTVKALRLALTMLEGEEASIAPQKKAK